jgi:putative ABC transport system permease protein
MQMFREAILQMMRDARSQKLRTFLTGFGIVWGTVAITLLLAFGTGMKKQMIKTTAGLGDRIGIAWPGLTSMPFQGLGKGRRIRVREEDLIAIRSQVPGLRAISAEFAGDMKMRYGLKTYPVDVTGVTPEFGEMRNLIPQAGSRFINPIDVDQQRRVLFLGNELAETVFGKDDPIGRTVIMNGSPFLIVGVLKAKNQDSSYRGRDHDQAFMPTSTYRALTGAKYVSNFVFQSKNVLETKAVTDGILTSLARRLRFDPADKEALSVWDTTEQFQFFEVFMLAFTGFLGIIGSLTLVVGGIGVSNIMNVVVEERTKEIGVKMALGARQRTILSQFLLETLLITGLGGIIGLAISFGICSAFPKLGLTEFVGEPQVSPLVALITTGILGVIGLVAGYFPARDAARLDPVVAMKL